MRKPFLLLASLLIILVSLFQGDGMAQVTLRVGDIGIAAFGPLYIAKEKGYFKERGIEVTLERFDSGAQMMAPMSTGELPVAGVGINPGLFNGLARGLPLKIVAAMGQEFPNYSNNTLAIRADLKEQIKRFADLKGRKVATNARGSAQEYMLGKMMESEGLSIKDLDIVYMPWPDMAPAFTRKAIDVGTLVEPFITTYGERGLAYTFKYATDLITGWQVSVIAYNRDWAEKNPKVARDFMVAHIKAMRDFYEWQVKGKNKEEIVGILIKYTPVKERALYDRMKISFHEPNGWFLKESIKDQQDWWAKIGAVPKKVDMDQYMDEGYIKYALEQLGSIPVERR